jgi:hypothetical protein
VTPCGNPPSESVSDRSRPRPLVCGFRGFHGFLGYLAPAVVSGQLASVINQPPFSLAPTTFRFPALAALAGRAPLGGQREVALATYMAARLADDVIPDRGIEAEVRTQRAGAAKSWLSNLALPAPIRPALARLIEASGGDRRGAAEAVRAVMTVTSSLLDARGRSELENLAAALDRS